MQQQLSAANGERIAKQSQFEFVSSIPEDVLPEIIADGPVTEFQTKVAELRREYTQLTAIYTPNHYKVKRLAEQIADAEANLKKERQNAITRVRGEYEAAMRREKLLASTYANQGHLVTGEATKAIGYDILKREVDTNRQLYESFLQKVKEAGIIAAMRGNNIRVIDPAKPPRGPYKPNIVLNAALGLLSGAFLALVVVFVREHADLSLKGPGDAAFYLKVPELGVIPYSAVASSRGTYGADRVASALATAEGARQTSTNGDDPRAIGKQTEREQIELVTWEHKPSLVAESFRATLTSILLSGRNGDRPHVLVFTSAGPKEGKTTTVCNLGIALAEINRRVILVDADMRKPRMHTIFDIPNTWGLSDLLREKSSLDTVPREALARPTTIPGLSVLTSGPASVSISNLLYSPRTAELMRRFRAEFDFVLIDTPPMMQIADARVLGRLADAVILVLGCGRTTRDAARAAKQRLTEDGIPVMGTILNRWDPKSASSYGVYGYYDGYYGKKSG